MRRATHPIENVTIVERVKDRSRKPGPRLMLNRLRFFDAGGVSAPLPLPLCLDLACCAAADEPLPLPLPAPFLFAEPFLDPLLLDLPMASY